jgi:hypothetical protein
LQDSLDGDNIRDGSNHSSILFRGWRSDIFRRYIWTADEAKLKRLCELLDASPLFKDELVTEAGVEAAISTLELTFKYLCSTTPLMVRTISNHRNLKTLQAPSIPTNRPSTEDLSGERISKRVGDGGLN